jgi:hypothetical protein
MSGPDSGFGPRPPLQVDEARQLLRGAKSRAVILVEGWSDQAALETLARRRGRDLAGEGIAVLPMGGITNLGKFARALGPQGLGLRLAGLCDAPEQAIVARELERQGWTDIASRAAREARGFFVCDADLEDELVRALGVDAVERVIASEGELPSFRRFQEQPAQRGRRPEAHLRRFLGTRARRKIRYGALLVEALPLDSVPRSLDNVLGYHAE